jgi:hypothetical protein
MLDPSLLECETLNYTDDVTGNGEQITRKAIHTMLVQYDFVIRFLSDWESGAFQMTSAEYTRLPATLMDARSIYRAELRRKRETGHGD